jgi:UDP-glucose 4-epimerase
MEKNIHNRKKKVLITGGLGYIGSHTAVELMLSGHDVVIADDLSNSRYFILDRIEKITHHRPVFYQMDVCDKKQLEELFTKETPVDIAIHFAAFKAVAESVTDPLKYYRNNIDSLLSLLEQMQEAGCSNLVFSSSATVYGMPQELPLKESTAFSKSLSAYGSTKQICEDMLEKVCQAGKLDAISLRYFNPVGAHESALIGELPLGTPNNLMPFITQTAIGKQNQLIVYGKDYPTPDGTCIRDYIHVVDLAKAHLAACESLVEKKNQPSYDVFNIGIGKGLSVMEMISTFEEVNGIKLNYHMGDRRPGDAAEVYADVTKAEKILKWKAEKNTRDMVKDAWRWEKAIQPVMDIV